MSDSITHKQVQLVKRTWKSFRLMEARLVADVFYSKLFSDDPSLRKMFPADMEAQYKKLMDMLSTIVTRLERLEELTDDIKAMAIRHVYYGVKPVHYQQVGSALLWTLQQGLGTEWTPEVKAAWTTCYTILADTMLAATNESYSHHSKD